MSKSIVYADNAATTPLDPQAFEAMRPFLLEEFGNASQPYSFSRSAKAALKEARETIADCIHAVPEEIVFTSGGTESDNWALCGGSWTGNGYGRIITSQIEHHAILRTCDQIERHGGEVSRIAVDSDGRVTPPKLLDALCKPTKLCSIMLANNEIGTIQPIERLTAIAHENGALFHTDAVQAVGHVDINVHSLGVDLLSASAHKFNGPKGIGFLYIRRGLKLEPYQNGGSQEFGLRAGTENVASIVGMAVALSRNVERIAEHREHIVKLEERILRRLEEGNLRFQRNGAAPRIPGNMSLSFEGASGEALLHRLDLQGICISTGSACDSVNTQVSHVLKAIGLADLWAKGTVRISLGRQNSEEDVDRIADAIKKSLNSKRK